jgi:predicted nuclease of predicted toxin-antitoxin system
MLILADENCDAVLVTRLQKAGHDVAHILEKKPGTPDDEILETAVAEDRILLTNDLEFGILAERLEIYPPAVVLMRLDPLRAQTRAEIIVRFFTSMQNSWRGKFFVVEPGLVRERLMERQAR